MSQDTSPYASDRAPKACSALRVSHAAMVCAGITEADLFNVDVALLRRFVETTSRCANLGQAVRIDRATEVRHEH